MAALTPEWLTRPYEYEILENGNLLIIDNETHSPLDPDIFILENQSFGEYLVAKAKSEGFLE